MLVLCCRASASSNAEQDEADVAELSKHLETIIGLSSAMQKCKDWQQERPSVLAKVQGMQAKCKSLDDQVLLSPPWSRGMLFLRSL